jgi:nucleotide-binding universal stress UspA family protein
MMKVDPMARSAISFRPRGGAVFTAIAWATDGSASASGALPVAEALARTTGARLAILYVREVTISRSGFLTEDDEAVLAALHHTARRLRSTGLPVTVLSSGATARDVPRKILELAGTAAADVVVVGTRRHGSLMDLALGGVTARLLRAARLPIIAVPSPSTVPVDADRLPAAARSGS